MLQAINKWFGFFQHTNDSTPVTPKEGFHLVSLKLCEKGIEIEAAIENACCDKTDAHDFYKWLWLRDVVFDLKQSSRHYILFRIIQSGNVDKLNALRQHPLYDTIPLYFQDTATGKTTLESCGSHKMLAAVQNIIRLQRLELKGGAQKLAQNGEHRYASGLSIIPSLTGKENSQARKMAQEAQAREQHMEEAITTIFRS